jgi:hypothetical protein
VNQSRFPLPKRSDDDLSKAAAPYRRLSAVVRNDAISDRLKKLAQNYEAMAEAERAGGYAQEPGERRVGGR